MRILATLVIAGICANPALADQMFTWTDEAGVVHFSQWAPNHTAGVTRLKTASSNAADYDPGSDPYSIQNQAARMNETWSKSRSAGPNAGSVAKRQKNAWLICSHPPIIIRTTLTIITGRLCDRRFIGRYTRYFPGPRDYTREKYRVDRLH